jgi:hypothetical protein
MVFICRGETDSARLLPTVEREVRSLDRQVPVENVATVDQVITNCASSGAPASPEPASRSPKKGEDDIAVRTRRSGGPEAAEVVGRRTGAQGSRHRERVAIRPQRGSILLEPIWRRITHREVPARRIHVDRDDSLVLESQHEALDANQRCRLARGSKF